MDNCGGHELDANLPALRIEFLTENFTHKNQTLDLGLISHAKIWYHSFLFRHIVDNTSRWDSGENHFPLSSNSGKFGVRDGHMSHLGDDMSLIYKSWSETNRTTILKCWTKNKCPSENQVEEARDVC